MTDMERTWEFLATLCACGHERGMHWHRASGVSECGEDGCACKQYADAADAAAQAERGATASDSSKECATEPKR
jgi:hypothetical protein